MKIRIKFWTVALLLCGILMVECKSTAHNKNYNHKKIKKGRPIPCPVKDC